jgi:hypothetical protein
MGRVSDDDLLPVAVAELYSSDPDEFIRRRGILAAHARKAGVPTAAKQISGLRKPTRSAWTVNKLVRAVPGVTAQLAELGEQLRAAQTSLDGAAIRDLSLQRRQLIDALTRQAFKVSGQHSPPAALREEVAATLGAALADPRVAERLQAGALERAARSDGFGTAGAPVLTLVQSSPARRRLRALNGAAATGASSGAAPPGAGNGAAATRAGNGAAATRAGNGAAATRAGNGAAATPGATGVTTVPARPAKAVELAAARAKAERERRRQAITEAERTGADADWALDAAARAEQKQERAVQALEEQLADARHRLAYARLSTRQARTAQRQARQALERLRK